MSSRSVATTALQTLVKNAFAWKTEEVALKLRHFSKVDKGEMPIAFVCLNAPEKYVYSGTVKIRTMEARIFIYTDGNVDVGSDQQTAILDALDDAFKPQGTDVPLGRVTLGDKVHNCRIEGEVLREPGDLDGLGIIVVPVLIVLP